MPTSEARKLLIVVGMHRSGTSALCAALQVCGASFGDNLLAPMAGVNADGFWEDADVVALNEALLLTAGSAWYLCDDGPLTQDWTSPEFAGAREEAGRILGRGFGAGPLEVVKDPRFCLTLPFWLDVCANLALATTVCVADRAPLEVAASLEKRDGFPPGYGLRLYRLYRQGIAKYVLEDAIWLRYDDLMADPLSCMQRLAEHLPLEVDEGALATAVRADLRHHQSSDASETLELTESAAFDAAALDAAIESHSPIASTLGALVSRLVERGTKLTEMGEAHTRALSTLEERDRDIDRLGKEHEYALSIISERDKRLEELEGLLEGLGEHLSQALKTIEERDAQIAEFDRRLSKLGEEHSYALNLIQARDEQLQRCFDKPGIGMLFRAMWKHEQR
jgi:hypothetical protein